MTWRDLGNLDLTWVILTCWRTWYILEHEPTSLGRIFLDKTIATRRVGTNLFDHFDDNVGLFHATTGTVGLQFSLCRVCGSSRYKSGVSTTRVGKKRDGRYKWMYNWIRAGVSSLLLEYIGHFGKPEHCLLYYYLPEESPASVCCLDDHEYVCLVPWWHNHDTVHSLREVTSWPTSWVGSCSRIITASFSINVFVALCCCSVCIENCY